jgi:hypothetical protein
MASEDKPVETEPVVVQPGDNMEIFTERHGVSVDDVLKHNEHHMRATAEARGFSHTFPRESKDESGKVTTSTDYHLFAGETMHIPVSTGKGSSKTASTSTSTSAGT